MFDKIRRISSETCVRSVEISHTKVNSWPLLASTVFTQTKAELIYSGPLSVLLAVDYSEVGAFIAD